MNISILNVKPKRRRIRKVQFYQNKLFLILSGRYVGDGYQGLKLHTFDRSSANTHNIRTSLNSAYDMLEGEDDDESHYAYPDELKGNQYRAIPEEDLTNQSGAEGHEKRPAPPSLRPASNELTKTRLTVGGSEYERESKESTTGI